MVDISIHALRKESDLHTVFGVPAFDISIHALRKESDLSAMQDAYRSIFQSTLSVRRATFRLKFNLHTEGISIHALRKESDLLPASSREEKTISIHALRKESDRR